METKSLVQFGGEDYEVIKFGPRDVLDPIPGVILLGNTLILKNLVTGKQILVYESDLD